MQPRLCVTIGGLVGTKSGMQSDPDELFLAWRDRGDLRALGELFDAQAPLLLALARHLCPSREDAEDAVQSTFLIAMERAASFDASRRLQPWLTGILAMNARKLRERRGRGPALEPLEVLERAHDDSPERAAIERELEQAVDAALERLPASYAPLLRRHVLEGLPPRELARQFELNDATARARVHRGLQMLRAALSVGLGGAASAQSLAPRSLAPMRRAVLARGAQLVGAPVPMASGGALWLAFTACALLLVAAASLWLRGESTDVAGLASDAATRAPDVVASAAPSTSASPREASTRVAAGANSSARASAPAHVVSGRLLLPDGAPAASVEIVRKQSPPSASARALFDDPEPPPTGPIALTDSDGAFSFALVETPSAPLSLSASVAGCAPLDWLVHPALEGARIDLGIVSFELAGAVEIELVALSGERLFDGWSVTLSRDAQSARGPHRMAFRATAAHEAASRCFRVESAPVGRTLVDALHVSGARLGGAVEVSAASLVRGELRYGGPDLARRVTVRASGSLLTRMAPPPADALTLRGAGIERRFERAPNVAAIVYVLDDVPPGAYEVELTDERFEPLVLRDVQPGRLAALPARGSAALRVRVVDPGGAVLDTPFALAASIASAGGASNDVLLHDSSAPAPEGGIVRGLLCGVELELSLRVAPASVRRLRVTPLAPGEVREVEIVHDVSRALSGRVVDADGAACASVLVELTRGAVAGHASAFDRVVGLGGAVPRRERWTRTDLEGRFRFEGLDVGPWTVVARLSAELQAEQLASADGEVELELPPHGLLALRVLAPEGADLAAVELEAWPAASGSSAKLARGVSAQLDAEGRATLGPLPLGPCQLVYTVRARNNSGEAWAPIDLGLHEVRAGDELERELDARSSFPARAELQLELDGVPGAGAWLELALVGDAGVAASSVVMSEHGTVQRRSARGASADSAGRVQLAGLRPGFARVVVIAPDTLWAWRAESTVQLAPGAALNMPLQLTTFERTVQLLALSGDTALAEREFELVTLSESGLHRATRRTDAQGRVKLRIPAQWVGFALPGDDPQTLPAASVVWGPGDEVLLVRMAGSQ